MYRPLFARSRLSVALGSALVLVAAAPAMAQQAATQEEKAEPASSTKTPVQLDRITVTGSRIYRAGFDTLEPAAVVSRESIENYGDTNLIDAVTRIPGVSAGVSSRGDQAGFGAGVNFASKFGLGSNRLLTLVNGRRFVTSTPPTIFGAGGGSGIQVDMNAIPSVMVQRIESLSVGGVPTYGSDAISGVNNIILRDKFDGAEVELGYGRTSKNDNERYSWSAIFGTDFADGRGHIVVAAELDNADGVNALQRDFYRQGYSLQANPTVANATSQPLRRPTNDGRIDGSIPFNTGPRDGIPDQVWIRNRRIASMTFGGLVMPATGSYTRNGLGDILGFGPNKDKLWQFNNEGKLVEFNPGTSYAGGNASGGDGLNLFETVPLIADLERRSVFSTGSFDFTDNVRGFFELSRYEATARETWTRTSTTRCPSAMRAWTVAVPPAAR